MNKISIGSLAVMMAVCATSAHALTIDFEDLGVAPGTQLNPPPGVSVTSHGFTYTPGPNNAGGFNDLHISSETFLPYNGTTVGGTHDDVILRHATGAPFSLQAFDFAGFPVGAEKSFSVLGDLVGGGVVAANFTPDGLVDGGGGAVDFQTFTLGAGWSNLDRVTWTHSGAGTTTGLFALDNIVVNQSPEPPPTGGLGLYGVQPATGTIVRVNPGTGATSPIASPAGLDATDTSTGLSGAEGGAVLIYENDQDGSSSDIQRYDPLTGALLSNHANGNWPTDGLTYHNGNIFYSHTLGDVHRQAGYGGPESFFFTSAAPVGGLGGDDLSRAFQNSTDGLIREFNPVTGAFVNSFLAPGGVEGLAFDGNFLYASTAAGSLLTLDPNSGAVLNSVIVAGGPLYALGVANSIPEPATTGLLAIGSLAVFLAARRRVSA